MIVKVAIDLALDRLFDYEVPAALEGKLAVGQLLSVPFGHREARGFAMALAAERSQGSAPLRLKAVGAIVDETPFFSSALLELVRRLAAYFAVPLESMLKAALPAAVLKKNVRPRELLFVEPALASPGTEVTKKQQWVYEQVVRLGGGWMSQLCQELATTPAMMRALGAKGFVTVVARQKRRDPLGAACILPSKPLALNPEQTAALKAIGEPDARALLLCGVTGSGKTEVYLQAIAAVLAAGRGAIVMVPEIALTPQTVQRFASRFGKCVAVLHSALSDGERYDEWHRIRSGEARVVVGPRSAVFAPVKDLGIIIVDEEHEPSYKQDENPRYNARDAAVLRGRIEGARVVLGSATPSLESWRNARTGKYALAFMRRRAGAGSLPEVRLVDMTSRTEKDHDGAIFSSELLDAISLRLDRGEQTILFLNRRGYSRQLTCAACGWVATCSRCDVAYTYHRADDCCRCHVCGGWIATPAACPECASRALGYIGIGTQRAEAALKKCLPRATVLRMDADSVIRRHSHEDILGAFRRGEADVLIGTQMIAKGLDFPNVTLVGVLNADTSLNMPDFRAAERTFQLLSQVAGRAGRAELPGEVFIQSHDPAVGPLQFAAKGDFEGFAAVELEDRRRSYFPPFCHLAVISLSSQDLKEVAAWAAMYGSSLANFAKKVKGFVVAEAVPSALEKADGRYRWQIVLRAAAAAELVRAWRWLKEVRPPSRSLEVSIDIDARNLV